MANDVLLRAYLPVERCLARENGPHNTQPAARMGRDPPPQPYPYSFVEPLQGVGNELDAILPRCPTSLEDGPREAVEQLARRRLVAARVDGRVAGSDGERAGAN